MPDAQEIVPYTYSFCRRCSGRVELGRVAFGDTVACPVCGFEFAIARPSHGGGAGQGRAVNDQSAADQQTVKAEEEQVPWTPVDLGLTLRLLFRGTFTFPLRPTTLCQTLTLCIGAIALVGAFQLGAWCVSADVPEIDKFTRSLLATGLAFSIAFGSVALPTWFVVASAHGMAILRETQWGVDVVSDWPKVLALEGLGESLYVFCGLLLAALPCAVVAPLWNWLGVPVAWAIGLGVALLFPILLLSMLAGDSPAHPFSLPVWKSLFVCAGAWIIFYLTTCAAAAAVVAVEIALRRNFGWVSDVITTGTLFAAAWMVYFRLLGRLGQVLFGPLTRGGCC